MQVLITRAEIRLHGLQDAVELKGDTILLDELLSQLGRVLAANREALAAMRQGTSRAQPTPGKLAQGESADGPRALGVPALLTYKQAGKVLGVSERTLWQLVEEGKIRRIRLGRLARIDPRDLDAFICSARGQRPSAV